MIAADGGENCPVVSIIIPTYERNAQLERCLQSVANVSYEPLEVVVVDGSFGNDASSIVEAYDATFVPQKPQNGATDARKLGVQTASGDLIHFLDDDDELLPGAISKKVEVMQANSDVGVVYSGVEIAGDHSIYGGLRGKSQYVSPIPSGRGNVLELALSFELVPCSNSLLLMDANLLETLLPKLEYPRDDLWMVVELAKRSEFEYVDEALVRRHDSPGSVGMSHAAVDEQKLVFEENSELYRQYPPRVKRLARADTHQLEGVIKLKYERFPFRATVAFAKAFYFNPGFSLQYMGMCVTSLFGYHVWAFTARVFVETILQSEHEGNI